MRRALFVVLALTSIARADGPRVTVEKDRVRIEITGESPIVIEEETKLDPTLKALYAKLPASSECKRGAKHSTPVRYVTAKVEAARPTDAVVTIDADKPSSGLVGIAAMLAYPTIVMVRAPGSTKTAPLGLRFCPVYSEAPAHLPSAVEIFNTGRLIAFASGGFDRRTLQVLDNDATTQELADAVRAQAHGLPIKTLRLTVHAGLDVGALQREVAVATEVGASEVVLLLNERREPDLLEVGLATVDVSGLDRSRVRAVVLSKMDAIKTCALRAAFVDPTFGKKHMIGFGVMADGTVTAATRAKGFAQCVSESLVGASIPRSNSMGTFTIGLSVSRSDPSQIETVGGVHGYGGW